MENHRLGALHDFPARKRFDLPLCLGDVVEARPEHQQTSTGVHVCRVDAEVSRISSLEHWTSVSRLIRGESTAGWAQDQRRGGTDRLPQGWGRLAGPSLGVIVAGRVGRRKGSVELADGWRPERAKGLQKGRCPWSSRVDPTKGTPAAEELGLLVVGAERKRSFNLDQHGITSFSASLFTKATDRRRRPLHR